MRNPASADSIKWLHSGRMFTPSPYLSPSGYTLTVVLDYKTLKLVAFASNEKSLTMQQGTFEPLGSAPR